jgi:class 3 adenylate cyclase
MSDQDNFDSGSMDLEKLLEKKELLEGMIRDKFTRTVSVMFTDLSGSTALAEREGDMATRAMIRDHNKIVFPSIEGNKGVFVKSMGDGTLSYFDDTMGALRAAVEIQKGIREYNTRKSMKSPVLIRVGIHTGEAIIEKHDIFGDVVNTASRFESSANASEIYISESTYNALSDKEEIPCRLIGEISLKGKSEPFKCYKAYWNPSEIAGDEARRAEESKQKELEKAKAAQAKATQPQAIKAQSVQADQMAATQGAPVSEEALVTQKAESFKISNELLQFYMYCEENSHFPESRTMRQSLISDLQRSVKKDTYFFGEQALWFFKNNITTGRLQSADFPITNLAFSRTPVTIGIRDGEGFLRVQTSGEEKVNLIEINVAGVKTTVVPNMEYSLGTSGSIIFSVCFPMEYNVYSNRFLTLRIHALEQCVQETMNMSLAQVWKNFQTESSRMLIIGS